MESAKEEKISEDEASSKETSEASLSAESSSGTSLSTLLPKALSAVLHHTKLPGPGADCPPREYSAPHASHPPNLEQLRAELTLLRGQFEQMKAQHNKEIKLLMNELDEEKRIRLTLQMEITRLKKHMSK